MDKIAELSAQLKTLFIQLERASDELSNDCFGAVEIDAAVSKIHHGLEELENAISFAKEAN